MNQALLVYAGMPSAFVADINIMFYILIIQGIYF